MDSEDERRSNLAWVAFDVDKIQEFVFASSRPVDVTGASELIKDLSEDRDWFKNLVGNSGEVIYANGGSGLLRVNQGMEEAQALAETLELEFRKQTLTGSCTAVALDPSWETDTKEGFQRLRRTLAARLQRRKAERAADEHPEAWVMPYAQRCDACGIYPGVAELQVGEAQEWVCPSCERKRELGREAKDGPGRSMPKMAATLDDIAGRDQRYLAVIYADANKAGQLALKAADGHQLQVFSHFLWKTVEGAVVETAEALQLQGRYQSPVIGGDDVLLFVPKEKALDALLKVHGLINQRLTNLPSELQGGLAEELKKLSFSYALLVAPYHLPIPYLYEYASALLRSSKAIAYENPDESAIDFHWITEGAPLSADLKSLREQFLTYNMEPGSTFPLSDEREAQVIHQYQLTRKPYLLEDFWKLYEQVQAFSGAGVSKGQLRRLAQLLENKNPVEAKVNVLYQAARTSELREALQQLSISPHEWTEFFFSRDKEEGDYILRTGLFDLLELFELYESKTEGENVHDKGDL